MLTTNQQKLAKEAGTAGVLLLPLFSVVRELVDTMDFDHERSKDYLAVFVSGAMFHILAEATGVNNWYLTNSAAHHKWLHAKHKEAKDVYGSRGSGDGRVCSLAVWACSTGSSS